MSDKVVVLSTKEEMRKRLDAVEGIDSHMQEQLFPRILEHAGQKKVASGVVVLLMLAVSDYLNGMPPQVTIVFDMSFENGLCDDFIDALVDDEEVRQEAKEFYRQSLANAKA